MSPKAEVSTEVPSSYIIYTVNVMCRTISLREQHAVSIVIISSAPMQDLATTTT